MDIPGGLTGVDLAKLVAGNASSKSRRRSVSTEKEAGLMANPLSEQKTPMIAGTIRQASRYRQAEITSEIF
ncbi:hypothetical protein [Rhizobium anhuiense]|uniref:hypothetical protein n=1 Tax=Rhizobium anhuiense TaxID=1184720 RepID=UPI00117BB96A|nr:hypothetical protein [Rhizobium anhuiense]